MYHERNQNRGTACYSHVQLDFPLAPHERVPASSAVRCVREMGSEEPMAMYFNNPYMAELARIALTSPQLIVQWGLNVLCECE